MITSKEPKTQSNRMYTIKETCDLLGIHRNTLRNYVNAGYIKPSISRITLRQRFGGEEILRFWRSFV